MAGADGGLYGDGLPPLSVSAPESWRATAEGRMTPPEPILFVLAGALAVAGLAVAFWVQYRPRCPLCGYKLWYPLQRRDFTLERQAAQGSPRAGPGTLPTHNICCRAMSTAKAWQRRGRLLE
jgi:hypothetical protein